MKKRLNFKALAVVAVASLLLGAAAVGIYQVQSRRNAEKLLAQVRRAEAEAEARAEDGQAGGTEDADAAGAEAEAEAEAKARAAKALERYLKYRPEDTDALARYGLALADLAATTEQRRGALEVLGRALARDPGREDLRRRAMRLALDAGRFTQAREHAEKLLGDHPGDGPATLALAIAEDAAPDGDPKRAAALYDEAIAADPSLVDAYTGLALLGRGALDDPARADRAIDAMVAANPDSPEARLARAAYLLDFGAPEGLGGRAAGDVARALELTPGDAEARLIAARVAARRSDWDGARGHLEAALAESPLVGELYRELADVELRAGRPGEAAAALARGASALPGDLQMKAMLAEAQLAAGATEEAEALVDDLARRSYNRGHVGYLRARLLMARGGWGEAAEQLEAIAPAVVGERELSRRVRMMLAACYGELGRPDRREATYRALLGGDPGAIEARVALAASLEARGDLDGALLQYRAAAGDSPEAALGVPRVLARRALARPDGGPDWAAVDAALDAAATALGDDDPRLPILRADVLLASGRPEGARRALEAALEAHPAHPEVWSARVNLALREGRIEGLGALLDDAERALGDTAALRTLRARAAVAEGGPDASARLAALAEGLDEATPGDERAALVRTLAAGRSLVGDPAGGLALWAPVAAGRPDDLEAQLLAFDLALAADDGPARDAALARIEAIQGPDGPEARLARARGAIEAALGPEDDRSGLGRARELLDALAEQRPDWPQVPIARARIAELEGDDDAALAGYLGAIERGAGDPAVLRGALQLLARAGRHDEAEALLERARGDAALGGSADRMASRAFAGAEDLARALTLAGQVAGGDGADYRDHLWHGQVLWLAGRRDEAEAPLRRAVAEAGDDPAPLFALIAYLNASGRPEDAAAAVAEAEATFTPEGAPLVLARAVELVGQVERAAALYERAVEAAPGDEATRRAYLGHLLRRGQGRRAVAYLETLVGGEGGSPPGPSWAREALGMLLAAGGEEGDRLRALELLGLGAAPGGAAPVPADGRPTDRLRAEARVLAVQPDEARRRQAIGLLEEITRRDPAAADDRLLLAQLREFTGDWDGARAEWDALLSAEPPRARDLIAHVEALLRNDLADRAGPALERLEEVQPGAARNVQLRAQVLAARGREGDGVALLRDYAGAHPDQLLPVAGLLERMGHPGAAEPLYRAYVDSAGETSDPQATLVLAAFLGRQRRTAEALDLCQEAAAAGPPGAIASAATAILVSGYDEAQARRVEGWIAAMLDRAPGDPELRTAMAILRSLQGRADEARAIYEEMLAEDGDNLVALNNLAWLHAQGGEPDRALELIGRAIDGAGPVAALLDTRAVAHLAAGRAEPAIRDLERAITSGAQPPMYFHLARAYAAAGRPDDARAALDEGRRLGLDAAALEPVERPAYAQLVAALGRGR